MGSGVAPGAPPSSIARSLVEAMSAPSAVDPAELPTWDSCAHELAQVYLASLGRGPAVIEQSPRFGRWLSLIIDRSGGFRRSQGPGGAAEAMRNFAF